MSELFALASRMIEGLHLEKMVDRGNVSQLKESWVWGSERYLDFWSEVLNAVIG